jgi:salicylate biosynthesis isochorismate synthase
MLPADVDLADVRRKLALGSTNVVRFDVTRGAALKLIGAGIGQTGVFWEQDGSSGTEAVTMVGIETAALVQASGPLRLSDMIQRQGEIFQRLKMDADVSPFVRFFGGSAFSAGKDGSGCWEDFGDSTFLLPRVLYVERPSGAELLVIDAPGAAGGTERSLEVLATVLSVMAETNGDARPQTSSPLRIESSRQSANPDEFAEMVLDAQAAILAGRVQKVALARRVTLTLSAAPNVGDVLGRLRSSAPRLTRFAFRIGERTFVGATPECLIKRSGLEVETEALAGTTAKTGADAAARLLSSQKDLDEHRYVVQALESALGPLCNELEVAAAPVIKELPRLLHLCTPIAARLNGPHHVLELVHRLHPSPAVCGAPTEAALDFIARHETAPRGWYAAPFGWSDRGGDGHFVVGLRSALLHGKNVHLYAGAGIVRASEPRLEYDETELKLESIRSALGLGDEAQRPAPPA